MLKKTWDTVTYLAKSIACFFIYFIRGILVFLGFLLVVSLIVFVLGGEKLYLQYQADQITLNNVTAYDVCEVCYS